MGTDQPPTPADDVWTVQRILEWTASFLKQKGIESSRLEAELLLAHARNCARIRLYTDFHLVVSDQERVRMREMVQRRARREPLAYIVAGKEFYGRHFGVGQGVLIPRPETETLVDVCLEFIPRDQPSRIVEVGFGSGCISITLARQREQCRIVATDISPHAMQFAEANAARHGVQERVQLIQGDCLQPLRDSETEKFDGLVSNPPYIRDDELGGLQPEVAEFEPVEALVAGADGLQLVRRIVADAPSLLRPGAFIALELDPAQCSVVAELLDASGFTGSRIHKDLSGLNRIVSAVRAETA